MNLHYLIISIQVVLKTWATLCYSIDMKSDHQLKMPATWQAMQLWSRRNCTLSQQIEGFLNIGDEGVDGFCMQYKELSKAANYIQEELFKLQPYRIQEKRTEPPSLTIGKLNLGML